MVGALTSQCQSHDLRERKRPGIADNRYDAEVYRRLIDLHRFVRLSVPIPVRQVG
jgi:hypothetical protein